MPVHAGNNNTNTNNNGGGSSPAENSLYKGVYTTMMLLQTSHPAPQAGSWAFIKVANGPDERCEFDSNDNTWYNVGQNNIPRVISPSFSTMTFAPVTPQIAADLVNGQFSPTEIHQTDTPVTWRFLTYMNGAYTVYNFAFEGGKGRWGAVNPVADFIIPGQEVYFGYFRYLGTGNLTPGDVQAGADDNTVFIELGDIPAGGFNDAANASERDLSDSTKNYFFTYSIEGVLYIEQFKDTNEYGFYGDNNLLQLDYEMFNHVTNSNTQDDPYRFRCDYGEIIFLGKGYTETEEGIIPNPPGPAAKGDFFMKIDLQGYVHFPCRYNGEGFGDFNNFYSNRATKIALPGEPGF